MKGFCQFLFYPHRITTLGDQNRILWHFWIFGPYFWIFPILTEKSSFEQIFCWITSEFMMGLCYCFLYPPTIPNLGDQNHIFGFLDHIFGFFPLWEKKSLGQMFCWISSGFMMELCYPLVYPLKITTFKDQNHILWCFWIFCLYFWNFPTLTEKVH